MRERVYPADFEKCWQVYPKRQPENPKLPAFKAWRSRLREGVQPAILEAATRGYATSIRARRMEGTERVMMAQTFYGPNERWMAWVPANGHGNGSTRPAAPAKGIPDETVDPQVGLGFVRGIIDKLSAKATIR